MLLIASAVVCLCSIGYAVTASVSVMLSLAVVHGFFWSGLLSASSAYLTSLVPERRRAEGIGYWGLSSIAAVAVAPPIAFWILQQGGWRWICYSCIALNALMGVIAWTLPRTAGRHARSAERVRSSSGACCSCRCRCSSTRSATARSRASRAVYADAIGVTPKSIYLTTLAVTVLCTRPLSGALADRIGHRRVFLPCLVLIAAGLGLLRRTVSRGTLVTSAIVFGLGFGTAYPVFVAYVLRDIDAHRRGARIRRDPRRLRHRHRDRIDDGRLADSTVRLPGRLRHRRRDFGDRAAVFRPRRPAASWLNTVMLARG